MPQNNPSSRQHIDILDYIRGTAIIAVYLFHLLGAVTGISHLPWSDNWLPRLQAPTAYWYLFPFSLGWCGVPIFFVVSGFCIHLSHTRNPNWRDFLSNRFFRIYPAYVAALLLFAFAVPWTRISSSFSGFAQVASHLALIHNFDNRTFYGINVAFWSIAVEVQLYLLYPLLITLVVQIGWRKAMIILAVLEFSTRAVASHILLTEEQLPYWITGIPLMYWFSWALGAQLAEAFINKQTLPLSRHSTWAWTIAAIVSTFIKPLASFSFLLFAFATATAIARTLSKERVFKSHETLVSRHISSVGKWSYSIYLLHAPFLYYACGPTIAILVRDKLRLDMIPLPLATLIVCLFLWAPIVALSRLTYQYIELPGISFGKRISKRNRDPAR